MEKEKDEIIVCFFLSKKVLFRVISVEKEKEKIIVCLFFSTQFLPHCYDIEKEPAGARNQIAKHSHRSIVLLRFEKHGNNVSKYVQYSLHI